MKASLGWPAGVRLTSWIENRIGAEDDSLSRSCRLVRSSEISKASQVEVLHGAFGSEVGVQLLGSHEEPEELLVPRRTTTHRQRLCFRCEDRDTDAFLTSLPPDNFIDEENTLRESLLEAWRDLTSKYGQRHSALSSQKQRALQVSHHCCAGDVLLTDLDMHPNVPDPKKKSGTSVVFMSPSTKLSA